MPTSTSLLFCTALAACCLASPVKSSSPPLVLLPKPLGPYQVGLSIAELVDHSRLQPFAPDAEPVRLMISVFYPVSHRKHGTVPVAYMPPETARIEDITLSSLQELASPNGTFEKAALQLASPKSESDKQSCTYPLVIFSPGQATTRLFYSQIASNIASLGYIVVSIDAPYDVDIVQYLDGSFAAINLTFWNAADLDVAVLAVQTRIQDASFVIDSLSNNTFAHSLIPNLPHSGLNTTHVGMFGHSLGGATSYSILGVDDRIIGSLNMDGTHYGPGVPLGTTKPFMLMGHENHTRETDPLQTWETSWANLTGWKRDVNVAGSLHYDFSDYPLLFEKLGIMPENQTIKDGLLVGSLKGERAMKIVTSYVGAFLGFLLHGKESKILDEPVKEFPEVSFEY